MRLATQGPWRQGRPPYESPNEIFGTDRVDGSKQLVAKVYGYSHDEIHANVCIILDFCNRKFDA
jgi:hypothetical protein